MSTMTLSSTYIGYASVSGSSWIAPTTSSPEWYAGRSTSNDTTYAGKLTFTTGSGIASNSDISLSLVLNQTSNAGYVRGYICTTDLTPSSCKSTSSLTSNSGYVATIKNTLSYGTTASGTTVTWTADNISLSSNTTYYVYFIRIGTDYNGFCAFKPSANISINYKTNYAVTYNANGGSGAPSTQYKIEGIDLTLSSTKPTRNSARTGSYAVSFGANGGSSTPTSINADRTTAYSFNTWNTNSSGTGTNYSAGGTYSTDAAITLYAVWNTLTTTSAITLPSAINRQSTTANGYTVTFNANDGSCSVPSLTVSDTVTYSFAGWNTNSSGSGTNYSAGSKYTPSNNTTLYAKWTSSVTEGSVALPTATRAGYAFAGWATSASATGGITGSYTPNGNVTLYAVWSAEGLAYIDNGSSIDAYQIFIDDGTGWNQYVPYIDNGSSFELYS